MTRTEKQQHRMRMDAIHEENHRIVERGVCPECGSPLNRNSSLTGWWQCVAYPTPSHRQPQYRDLPKCEYQCFTD